MWRRALAVHESIVKGGRRCHLAIAFGARRASGSSRCADWHPSRTACAAAGAGGAAGASLALEERVAEGGRHPQVYGCAGGGRRKQRVPRLPRSSLARLSLCLQCLQVRARSAGRREPPCGCPRRGSVDLELVAWLVLRLAAAISVLFARPQSRGPGGGHRPLLLLLEPLRLRLCVLLRMLLRVLRRSKRRGRGGV